MAILRGQDSVSPSGMQGGLDVYAGYDGGAPGYRNGSYSNMAAIKARFPGKRYLSVGFDCIDIEPGLASPSQGPAFVRQWTRHNTAKPVVYASMSQMGAVRADLNGAGISRSAYYLWVAEWNGGGIPAGYDGIQNGSTSGYDSDLFEDYMFTGAPPLPPPPSSWPLSTGSSSGAIVSHLQADLNRWGPDIHLPLPLMTDGSFGPRTKAAVILAQAFLHQAQSGTVSQALYDTLQGPEPKVDTWAGMSGTPYLMANLSWPPRPGVSTYELEVEAVSGLLTDHQAVTGLHAQNVKLGKPGQYKWRVTGGGSTSPWRPIGG